MMKNVEEYAKDTKSEKSEPPPQPVKRCKFHSGSMISKVLHVFFISVYCITERGGLRLSCYQPILSSLADKE
jgi:hypothetical protein